MSAIWRRVGELVVRGVPYREAVVHARAELEQITWPVGGNALEHVVGLGCWCGPYRDGIEASVIIHRRSALA